MIGFSAIVMRNIFLKNQRTIKIRLYIMEAGGSSHYLNSFPSIRPETFPAARRAMRRAMRPFLIAFTSPNILAIRYSQLRVLLMLIIIYLIDPKQKHHNPFWIRCKVKKQTEYARRCEFSKFKAAKSRRRMNWERKPKSAMLIQDAFLAAKTILPLKSRRTGKAVFQE